MEEENQSQVVTDVYLEKQTDKGPVKVHFRMSGGFEVLDDIDSVIKTKLENGYQPESRGGGFAAPSSGNQGATSSGERPTKFEISGTVWYVNQSKKEPGKFYVARKDKASGKYEYLKGEAVPAFVREAYGDALS